MKKQKIKLSNKDKRTDKEKIKNHNARLKLMLNLRNVCEDAIDNKNVYAVDVIEILETIKNSVFIENIKHQIKMEGKNEM